LMRRGAVVYPVMTKASRRIIHADLMYWATGNKPVTKLTGRIEHVALAGNVAGKADILVVAPATANTISKIAAGIDDTPVTSVVTTGLGEGIPLLIVPAMHESMYNHPVLKENMEKLKRLGVRVLDARIEEGKAKIAETNEIISAVIDIITSGKPLAGKKILVSAGATIEYIDPVRIITNKSSGLMGMALVREAQRLGAVVTVIAGRMTAAIPQNAKIIRVETAAQMHDAVISELKEGNYAVFISVAAVGDWTAKEKSEKKIPTRGKSELKLSLVPTHKIIDDVRNTASSIYLVAFRATVGLSEREMIDDAYERLKDCRADLVIANDIGKKNAGFDVETNEVYIVDNKKNSVHVPLDSKERISEEIFSHILKNIQ
ncbi:MAG: bifunctional phosphopantothenoylcysteine decarboxylase/phosphopantothenate--cysteine ligase CoaBC, partial [Spirochaetales bacterium]|nr:bifunctional phosphopantothenoylcysteine decarboxylase/phosphopantothenate--cysteine ligase CoaBC [Spirochaetales bacterium]